MSSTEGSSRTGCQSRLRFRGKRISEGRIAKIQQLVRDEPGWSRTELARHLCRVWSWRHANGDLSVSACGGLLRRLDAAGLIRLPAPRTKPGRRKADDAGDPGPRRGETPAIVTKAEIDLKQVEMRLIRSQERSRWQQWMAQYHYLGAGRLVGECLRYVAEYEGQWLALSGWGAAAMKSRLREAYVGWDSETRWQRLHLVANHLRFLIPPWVRVRNLASCVLGKNVKRLREDWWAIYGHPIVLVETFVDLGRFRGSSYRAANWTYLGQTRGYGKSASGYRAHGEPKGLFVYPLDPRAREILSSPLPPVFAREPKETAMVLDASRLPIEGQGSLSEVLGKLPDPRDPRGVRHPYRAVLAASIFAILSGARGFQAIWDYVSALPWETLKKLGFRRKAWGAPSEPTIRRVLQSTDATRVDQEVGAWVERQSELKGKGVAIDGKTARGSADGERKAIHLLSAVLHEEGVVLGQQSVGEKTNEITHLKPLLEPINIEGAVVTADSMHTQREAARYIVEEKQADYVFLAKDNQPTLRQDIEAVDWESFFPGGADGADLHSSSRSDRDPHVDGHR